MSEEMYATVMPDGRTFRCIKSQLMKTAGYCPISKKNVCPEYNGHGKKPEGAV